MSRSIQRISPQVAWYGCGLLFFLAFIFSIGFGAVSLPFIDVLHALWTLVDKSHSEAVQVIAQQKTQTASLTQAQIQTIVNDIRLPRSILAACVGAMLAMSGAAMQGLFRNPLADPSLIGVTAGAVAGASSVIVLASSGVFLLHPDYLGGLSLISLGAFLGGVATVALVYRLASSSSGTSVSTMLLAGIAITALVGGYTSLLEFSSDNQVLRKISLWRMGGLDGASYRHVALAGFFTLLLFVALPFYARALNVLLLGESEARHLGVNVDKIKLRLILLVAAGVGVAVALSGSIAFVGLVVPHIMRLLIGPDHRHLLPISALAGATLLLFADGVARLLIAPAELPVGVMTALLGAPFFISLLRRRHIYGFQ